MLRHFSAPTLLAAAVLLLSGCGRMGQVEQGRVVEYDAANGIVKMVAEPVSPETSGYSLTPSIVKTPADPAEMGPAPRAGGLVAINPRAGEMIVFDAAANTCRKVAYKPVRIAEHVPPDSPRVAGKTFPVLDRTARTITVYSPADAVLLTFEASDSQLSLPPEAWTAGDQVRYYYKQPGQALRMMNVTRTEMRNAGE